MTNIFDDSEITFTARLTVESRKALKEMLNDVDLSKTTAFEFMDRHGNKGRYEKVDRNYDAIKEVMCDQYCKYPYEWDAEVEGCELAESDVCKNCPLNRL